MAEDLKIDGRSTKQEKYEQLIPQLESLLKDEADLLANSANICAALKETFGFLWVGIYRVIDEALVLGPFQGPVACTRIAKGKGVCGKSWQKDESIVVKNVDDFPGHIACSSLSRSEIVVPIHNSAGTVSGILDIDSDLLGAFDEVDEKFLSKIVALLEPFAGI